MNSRFVLAIQIVTLLAEQDGPVRSEYLAAQLDIDSAQVRRVLTGLRRARLTEGRLGPGGGARLVLPAERITLADVYRGVQGRNPFGPTPSRGRQRIGTASSIVLILEQRFAAAAGAMLEQLASFTIADVLRDARRATRNRRPRVYKP